MNKIVLFLIGTSMLTSCASILNGKQQTVDVITNNQNSVVYVDGIKQGQGSTVATKMARDRNVKQVRIETEGFKDQYVINYQNQKSPLYIMSWVPFGVVFLMPPVYDVGPKSFNYSNELLVNQSFIPIETKSENQKFLFVKNTEFDLDEEKLKYRKIRHSSLKKKKNNFKEIDSNYEEIKFDNSIFTASLNKILLDYKYTDSTNTIFKNKTNAAYLSAKISELDLQLVYNKEARRYMRFLKAQVIIDWDLQDIYSQSVYKQNFKTTSGEFSIDVNEDDTALRAVEDAIATSFLKFIGDEQTKKFLLKDYTSKKIKQEKLIISKANAVNSIDQAVNATVTVKVGEGHGSGFKIGKEGYIITNYHVITNSEKITIITKDKRELDAVLVRKNEALDLALLKVEETFDVHFNLPKGKDYNLGEDIFIIGTPTSIELGNTLSKGIISGDREDEGVKLIQTDASINSGNSGGPLISKSSNLLGVVNAKMSGFGIEGLGFAIPAELIKEALSIE